MPTFSNNIKVRKLKTGDTFEKDGEHYIVTNENNNAELTVVNVGNGQLSYVYTDEKVNPTTCTIDVKYVLKKTKKKKKKD